MVSNEVKAYPCEYEITGFTFTGCTVKAGTDNFPAYVKFNGVSADIPVGTSIKLWIP